MSQQAVEQILGKMLTDDDFRMLMVLDREKALADFDLTDEELNIFNDVDFDDYDESFTGLDERAS